MIGHLNIFFFFLFYFVYAQIWKLDQKNALLTLFLLQYILFKIILFDKICILFALNYMGKLWNFCRIILWIINWKSQNLTFTELHFKVILIDFKLIIIFWYSDRRDFYWNIIFDLKWQLILKIKLNIFLIDLLYFVLL